MLHGVDNWYPLGDSSQVARGIAIRYQKYLTNYTAFALTHKYHELECKGLDKSKRR
jgi:hypothetical protein